ncbi:MAG: hypothetical protein ABI977_28155 [Acidobacteriota bacterium]
MEFSFPVGKFVMFDKLPACQGLNVKPVGDKTRLSASWQLAGQEIEIRRISFRSLKVAIVPRRKSQSEVAQQNCFNFRFDRRGKLGSGRVRNQPTAS